MATITELVQEIGDDNFGVQILNASYKSIHTRKNFTEVALCTSEPLVDIMDNRRVGVVIWVDGDKYREALAKLNNKDGAK